jgi:hypothetical protein
LGPPNWGSKRRNTMAVPVHDNQPDEVRIHDKFDADPEHARSILEREFPMERSAGDEAAGGQHRKLSRIALIVGTVLLMVAAFAVGYMVRGSDTEPATATNPAVAAPMAPVSPDAIDRLPTAAPMTPVSPDAIDRLTVASADMYGSADAAERWIDG